MRISEVLQGRDIETFQISIIGFSPVPLLLEANAQITSTENFLKVIAGLDVTQKLGSSINLTIFTAHVLSAVIVRSSLSLLCSLL